MNPINVLSCFLIGDELEQVLFKTAIYFAERGISIWFISPERIQNIPENVKSPGKEVLQLITFLYLKTYEDLLHHLNGVHLWHKKPNMIILNGFDIYCNLKSENYNSLLSASICASVLDNASALNKIKTFLLVALSDIKDEYERRLNVLIDMYFPNVFRMSETICEDIVNYFKVK